MYWIISIVSTKFVGYVVWVLTYNFAESLAQIRATFAQIYFF